MWGDCFLWWWGMQETGRRNLSKTPPAFSQKGIAALRRKARVFAPSEILFTRLHERGRCAGAGVSVMVLVVSTLFPKFLSPSSLSEGEEEARAPSPLSAGSREAPSALPKGKANGAQALASLLCPQDDTQQKRISCCSV